MIRINGQTVHYQGAPISCGDFHGLGDPGVRVNGVPVATLTQLSLGHDGFPPTPIVQALGNVRVNGLTVASYGSAYAPHTRDAEIHAIRLAVPF